MRRRRAIAAALTGATLLVPMIAAAQVWVSRSEARTFVALAELPGIAGVQGLTFDRRDDGQAIVALPFAFRFQGSTYTSVRVGTNGLFTFGDQDAAAYSNQVPGSPQLPDLWIAPFWDDLQQETTQSARAGVLGAEPQRIVVIEAGPANRYGASTPTIHYQLWLYEGPSGRFEFLVAGALANASGTVGWEGAGGLGGGSPFDCSPDCDEATVEAMQGRAYVVETPNAPELTGLFGALPRGAAPGSVTFLPLVISNLGVQTATAVTVALALSEDDRLDAADPRLGTVMAGSIRGASERVFTATVTVPSSAGMGDFRVLALLDAGQVFPEINEDDNLLISSTRFATSPELSPVEIVPVQSAQGGGLAAFDVTIANTALPYIGEVGVRVYASRDRLHDTTDPLLLTQTVGLTGATEEIFTLPVSPLALPAGRYSAIAALDGDRRIREINELNNTLVAAATFVVGPDLTVREVITASQAAAGQPLQVATTLESQEAPVATAVAYRLVLSEDEVIDPADWPLGNFSVQLAPDERSRLDTRALVMPSLPPGAYFVLATVDPEGLIAEIDEGNNTRATSAPILNAPDFSSADVVVSPTGQPGSIITVTAEITRAGVPFRGSLPYRLRLSLDRALDPQDTALFSGSLLWNAEPSAPLELRLPLPADVPPGRRHLILELDPAGVIPEVDESNNWTSSAAALDVLGPDLVPQLFTVPDFGYAGTPVAVSVRVKNQGRIAAPAVRVALLHSTDAHVDESDPAIALSATVALAPGQSRTVPLWVTFPIPAPSAWLGALVDPAHALPEEEEDNNLLVRSAPIAIWPALADLAAEHVMTPTIAGLGEPLLVTQTVTNLGQADAADVEVAIVLSMDPTVSAGDVVIGRRHTSLPAGASETIVEEALLPSTLDPGQYYVGLSIDPEDHVPEADERNNRLASPAVSVVPAGLRFLNDHLPTATRGVAYETVIFTRGGWGSRRWAIVSGALPPGLTMDRNTGTVAGIPEQEGRFDLVVEVSSGASRIEGSFGLLVAPPGSPLAISTSFLPNTTVDRPLEVPLGAVGGQPPYQWSSPGGLPEGLEVLPSGKLAGTPRTAGRFRVTLSVQDALLRAHQRDLPLTIRQAGASFILQPQALRAAVVGRAYCEPDPVRMAAVGGVPPLNFHFEPPEGLGLTLSPSGELCGVPEVAGDYDLIVTGTEATGLFDTALYLLEVRETTDLTLVTRGLPLATLGQAYTSRLDAIGGTPPYAFRLAEGHVPNGITLLADGSLTGMPDVAGMAAFAAQVTDARGSTDLAPLALAVHAPESGEGGCGCSTLSATREQVSLAGWIAALFILCAQRRRLFLSTIAALLPAAAQGAPSTAGTPYQAETSTHGFVPLAAPTVLFAAPFDDSTAGVTLPFAFRSYDREVRSVRVGTNGALLFETTDSVSAGNSEPGSTSTPNAFIAPFWDDLYSQSSEGGQVAYAIEGAAPARRVTFEWLNVDRYSGTTPKLSFQVRLFEGPSGRLEIDYGQVDGAAGTVMTGTMGMEDASGHRAILFDALGCTSSCDLGAVAALNQTRLSLWLDLGTDLLAAAFEAPPLGYQGTEIKASAVVSNVHRGALGPFRVAVTLDRRGIPGSRLITSPAITLLAFEPRAIALPLLLPSGTPPGNYELRLEVDADHQVREDDEANNAAVRALIVEAALPDLQPRSIRCDRATASAGEPLELVGRVANAGTEPAPNAEILVLLSENGFVSPNDLELLRVNRSIPPGEAVTTTVSVTLPAALKSGRFWVGLVADPQARIPEQDELNNALTGPTIVIRGRGLAVATATLPPAVLEQPYFAALDVAGTTSSVAWEVSGGGLPAGILLDPGDGTLYGSPLRAGTFAFTARAEAEGRTATRALELQVLDPSVPLAIATRTLTQGFVGQEYEHQLVSIGGAPTLERTWSATGLPPGFEVSAAGRMTALPREVLTASVTFTVSDGLSTSAEILFLSVASTGRVLLAAEPLPEATLEAPYTHRIRAQNATSLVVFSLTFGSLPEGLVLETDGTLHGVPRQVGRFPVIIAATDVSASDANAFVLVVRDRPGFLVITSALPPARLGDPYSALIESSGGAQPIRWRLAAGRLPKGLNLDFQESRGQIRGVPEQQEVAGFVIEAADAAGRTATRVLGIDVLGMKLEETDAGCRCATSQERERGPKDWIVGLAILTVLGTRPRRSSLRSTR